MSYKILWYSIPSLHDTSNGAAIRCKLMLEKLLERGFTIKVMTAYAGDDESGMKKLNEYVKLMQQAETTPRDFFQFTDNGIDYFLVKTEARNFNDINFSDQKKLYVLYTSLLEQYQPDLVMGYSGDFFTAMLWREAKLRHIPVVYALCNGLHKGYAFPDCSLVFTTSKATCDLYAERDGVEVKHTGNFIEKSKVVSEKRNPIYITMINPGPQKGIALFMAIAESYHKKHPEQRFLLVKSSSNYNAVINSLHGKNNSSVKSRLEELTQCIDVAEHTDDISRVYAVTKVLIAPSLWHESWGRVATEANFNGIPALVTSNNGLHEAIADKGGIVLDAPQCCLEDEFCMPDPEEVTDWCEALERLVNEDWSQACAEASEINDIERSTDRLVELITPLAEKGNKEKTPTEGSFYVNAKAQAQRYAKNEA